jgi:hypothetical protein
MNVSSSTIGGWTLIGDGGDHLLNLVANNYNEDWGPAGILRFIAEEGNQSLDLTGTGNQGENGIQQTVSTVPGTAYHLSFYLGHADDHYTVSYSGPTTVDLLINGIDVRTYINDADTPNGVNWALESYSFLADSTSTSIGFLNLNTNNYAGLDNVSLVSNPEPGTFRLIGGALILAAVLTLRGRHKGGRRNHMVVGVVPALISGLKRPRRSSLP